MGQWYVKNEGRKGSVQGLMGIRVQITRKWAHSYPDGLSVSISFFDSIFVIQQKYEIIQEKI